MHNKRPTEANGYETVSKQNVTNLMARKKHSGTKRVKNLIKEMEENCAISYKCLFQLSGNRQS